jgi:hypothetical protein
MSQLGDGVSNLATLATQALEHQFSATLGPVNRASEMPSDGSKASQFIRNYQYFSAAVKPYSVATTSFFRTQAFPSSLTMNRLQEL